MDSESKNLYKSFSSVKDSIFNWPDGRFYLFSGGVVLHWDDEIKEKCTLK